MQTIAQGSGHYLSEGIERTAVKIVKSIVQKFKRGKTNITDALRTTIIIKNALQLFFAYVQNKVFIITCL